jgi:uncharacterized protein (DUF486 family)
MLARTVLFLIASNIFMTVAWYGHLKFKHWPLWLAIFVSWGIAFFEYCLQVPANRWSYGLLTGYQLKLLQEVITLAVFIVFASFYLGEGLKLKYLISFVLMGTAVAVAFWDR